MDLEYKPPSVTPYAAWCALFAAITGLFQYGYAIGSINSAYQPVTNSIRDVYEQRYNTTISADVVEAVWITLSAVFPVGGIFGSLLVGPCVRRFGRLKGLLLGHCATAFTSLLCGISGVLNAPELVIIGRFGLGISAGMIGTGITVMYIAEVSPRHLRGFFGTMVSASIAIGLILSNFLGIAQIFGNETFWPLLLSFAGLPSVFFILLIKTLSESPRKVYLEDKNTEKARKILQRLAGLDDVSSELEEMESEHRQFSFTAQLTVIQLITSSSLRRPTVVAVVLAAAQQMTGINGVNVNTNNIYLEAGIAQEHVHYVTIGVLVLVLLVTLCSARLVEKYGRKILLTAGYVIEGLSLILLTITMETQHLSKVSPYISVAASIGFWIGFSIGPGPVTLLTIAEFFDQSSRPAAITLSSVILWISFAIAVTVTPYMLPVMHGYTFLPYGLLALFSVLFIQFYVPETKNRPFNEIQNSFISNKKRNRTGQTERHEIDSFIT